MAAGRGRNEWAGEAKEVGKGALFCSLSKGGHGKDSPPALPEGRMQMGAIKRRCARVCRLTSFIATRTAGVAAAKAGRLACVPCFHSDKR